MQKNCVYQSQSQGYLKFAFPFFWSVTWILSERFTLSFSLAMSEAQHFFLLKDALNAHRSGRKTFSDPLLWNMNGKERALVAGLPGPQNLAPKKKRRKSRKSRPVPFVLYVSLVRRDKERKKGKIEWEERQRKIARSLDIPLCTPYSSELIKKERKRQDRSTCL